MKHALYALAALLLMPVALAQLVVLLLLDAVVFPFSVAREVWRDVRTCGEFLDAMVRSVVGYFSRR